MDRAESRRGITAVVLIVVVVGVATAWLYGPAVSFALTGDSYQWIQHAHRAAHHPALLFSDLDGFFRPSATWLLVADRVVWGGFNASGYRATSFALHALSGFLLGLAALRFGLSGLAAVGVALVWTVSPFTDESVLVVACRHELLLLVPWLAMIIVWPSPDDGWSRGRVAAVGLLVVLAAAAKETWVVTPALVAALELERTRSWRAAVVPTGAAALAVAAYLGIYALLFRSAEGYMELGSHLLAKLPNQVASFLYLEQPMVDRFSVTWRGVLVLAVVSVIAVDGVRRRLPGAVVATVLFVAPTLPTLAVPYMPQRYLTIPYAGFVLLMAVWLGGLIHRQPRHRLAIRATATVITALMVAAGAALVRADMEDYRRIAVAHQRLLDEAAAVAPVVAEGPPVIVVRDENVSPLHEIVASPAGLPKLAFIRSRDPYGLIDTAALFEWVLRDEQCAAEHILVTNDSSDGVEGRILIHRSGRFVDGGTLMDVWSETRQYRDMGRHVQVIQVVSILDR